MMEGIFDNVTCTPSRKPIKFSCSNYSRHCLLMDSTLSREDRHIMVLEIFACSEDLVDHKVLPSFSIPRYAPEDFLELRIVSDHRHPAYGQLGLYARKNIPSNTVVTSYSGFIEVFGSSCNSRTYTMGFGNLGDDFALDAEFAGNYGRFANDPRGVVGLAPNLIAESRFNARGESFTALVSRRQILQGEEILMSYGKAHSLRSSPWNNVEGSPVLRHRWGGMIPFPVLQRKDFAYSLMWECSQCGMWSLGKPHRNDIIHCYHCGTPQIAGSPIVGLMSNPISKEHLVREIETHKSTEFVTQSDATPDTPTSENGIHLNASTPVFQAGPYSSVKAEWPMNTPFLPWQIWDPTVPMHAVLKHSRFESQEDIFVYGVTVSLDRMGGDGEEESGQGMIQRKNDRALKRSRSYEQDGATIICSEFLENHSDSFYRRAAKCLSEYPATTLDTSDHVSRLLFLNRSIPETYELAREQFLQLRRRLYAGKTFNKEDLVGYVGGVIRHISDKRCRPDNSSLQIPMKYFIPWRRQCEAATRKTSDPAWSTKVDLFHRFSQLELIVTNEMMYCPCLIEEGDETAPMHSSINSTISHANVAFALTIDNLGCPYVACVATKRVSAFDPLLARLQ